MGPRIAALDLGSNSLKITVAEVFDGAPRVIEERAIITRVGEGLDKTKRVSDAAADRTLIGLRELVGLARSHGAQRIACVGTAGLRGAVNAPEFLARVREELDLEVEIIDGLREAELAFRAPAMSYGPGPIVVLDVGGRSTELVTGSGSKIDGRTSIEMGSVRLTERFIAHDPPHDDELAALSRHVLAELSSAPAAPAGSKLIGVSGTVMSMMGVQLDTDDMDVAVARGEGAELQLASVRAAYEDLRRKTTAERLRGTVIPPGRADVIVAGAMIIVRVMEHYGVTSMIASNRGVRWGLLYELASA